MKLFFGTLLVLSGVAYSWWTSKFYDVLGSKIELEELINRRVIDGSQADQSVYNEYEEILKIFESYENSPIGTLCQIVFLVSLIGLIVVIVKSKKKKNKIEPNESIQEKVILEQNKNISTLSDNSENNSKYKSSSNRNVIEITEEGTVVLDGSNKQLVLFPNKVLFKAKTDGIIGILNRGTGKASTEVYYNDIRSITVFEGSSGMSVIAAIAGGSGSDIMMSQPYLKIELKGINSSSANSNELPQNDPYAIHLGRYDIENAKKAKASIEEQMSKFASESITQGRSHISCADELKKFAELKEQGIISEDEFNSKKKDLLGL